MEKGYWIKSGKNGNCPEEEIDSLKEVLQISWKI